MANIIITRRDALRLDGGRCRRARAFRQRPARRSHAPTRRRRSCRSRSGASLRILRPARFVEPDEVIFRANTAKFQQTTGIETRVDFVGWEDIRQQTAVASNTGTGPDIVLGWGEDPHIYADKLIELSRPRRVSRQALRRLELPRREVRQEGEVPTTGSASRSAAPPARSCYRQLGAQGSRLRQASRTTTPSFLKLCQALKRINKPAGFALGNAVGDGNGFANWLIWSHGGYLVDEDGKVAINSKETIAALNYLKDLYPTLRAGHAGLGRSQQQPRLCGQRVLAHRRTASRSTSR